MKGTNSLVIQDISLLYELALATGKSLDLTENCKQFLRVLMYRKSLTFSSVWIKQSLLGEKDENKLKLVFATPRYKATEQEISNTHFINQKLEGNNFIVFSDKDENFDKVIQENDIGGGVYIIFKLKDIGFLKLFAVHGDNFNYTNIHQLTNVIRKFGVILEGCLAYRRLEIEANEKIKARDALIQSQEILRKIIDTSLDALITIDEEGKIMEWSHQAQKIFGYTEAEAEGQIMSTLIVPHEYRDPYDKSMQLFLETGEGLVLSKRIEIKGLDKAGREFPIELSITPIKLKNRYIFSGFIRDIAERKKAEAELIRAKQVAEQARLAEQQFLANMSHEIRTPMNAVIGMTHLLEKTETTPLQKEYIDSLQFSADSLMGILNNILDLSKIEANELVFENRQFDLLELMQGLQQTFQLKVSEKPVSVVFDFDQKIKNMLVGDPVRLTQILTNLMGNASKFTHRGTIGIKSKLLVGNDSQYIIQFQVYDTGIGIDRDKIDLIFQNFKQADIAVHRKFGGTGLGLAIVKQLVEMQGGSIDVDSEKGRGSMFTVTLPFGNSGLLHTEKPKEKVLEKANNVQVRGLRILVVEDNTMNQKLVKKILNLWDCQYEIASNGLLGIEASAQEKFDFILMDIHMPEMDGVEATTHIRSSDKNPNQNTPIIALTAAALLDEKNRALKAGMNDFLAKPFSPDQLQKVLLKWLDETNLPIHIKNQNGNSPERRMIPTVDLENLKMISRGDKAFIREMIEVFLQEIPSATDKMHSDFDEQNYIAVCDTAHRIKSNFMMLGMKKQQQMALHIEKMVRNERVIADDLQQLVKDIKKDTDMVYPILREKLKSFI